MPSSERTFGNRVDLTACHSLTLCFWKRLLTSHSGKQMSGQRLMRYICGSLAAPNFVVFFGVSDMTSRISAEHLDSLFLPGTQITELPTLYMNQRLNVKFV